MTNVETKPHFERRPISTEVAEVVISPVIGEILQQELNEGEQVDFVGSSVSMVLLGARASTGLIPPFARTDLDGYAPLSIVKRLNSAINRLQGSQIDTLPSKVSIEPPGKFITEYVETLEDIYRHLANKLSLTEAEASAIISLSTKVLKLVQEQDTPNIVRTTFPLEHQHSILQARKVNGLMQYELVAPTNVAKIVDTLSTDYVARMPEIGARIDPQSVIPELCELYPLLCSADETKGKAILYTARAFASIIMEEAKGVAFLSYYNDEFCKIRALINQIFTSEMTPKTVLPGNETAQHWIFRHYAEKIAQSFWTDPVKATLRLIETPIIGTLSQEMLDFLTPLHTALEAGRGTLQDSTAPEIANTQEFDRRVRTVLVKRYQLLEVDAHNIMQTALWRLTGESIKHYEYSPRPESINELIAVLLYGLYKSYDDFNKNGLSLLENIVNTWDTYNLADMHNSWALSRATSFTCRMTIPEVVEILEELYALDPKEYQYD